MKESLGELVGGYRQAPHASYSFNAFIIDEKICSSGSLYKCDLYRLSEEQKMSSASHMFHTFRILQQEKSYQSHH